MKHYKSYIILVSVFVVIEILATYFSFRSFQQVSTTSDVLSIQDKTNPIEKLLPKRIVIPAIGLYATTKPVGITPDGAMEVPANVDEAGWYKLGPLPGQVGSAVIAGHYDNEKGELGVFGKLHIVKAGDKIYIEDTKGEFTSFTVQEIRVYNPTEDASAVFGQNKGKHLNLITCDGVWDKVSDGYTERLVIFADATE